MGSKKLRSVLFPRIFCIHEVMDCVRGCLFSIEPNRLGSFLPEMRETEDKQNSHIIVNCAVVNTVCVP